MTHYGVSFTLSASAYVYQCMAIFLLCFMTLKISAKYIRKEKTHQRGGRVKRLPLTINIPYDVIINGLNNHYYIMDKHFIHFDISKNQFHSRAVDNTMILCILLIDQYSNQKSLTITMKTHLKYIQLKI